MGFVCRDLERMNRKSLFSDKEDSAKDKLYEIQEQLKQLEIYSPQHIELAQNLFLQATAITENALLQNLDDKISDARKERIMAYLNAAITNKSLPQAIDDFTEQNRRLANKLSSTLLSEINERSAQTFSKRSTDSFTREMIALPIFNWKKMRSALSMTICQICITCTMQSILTRPCQSLPMLQTTSSGTPCAR